MIPISHFFSCLPASPPDATAPMAVPPPQLLSELLVQHGISPPSLTSVERSILESGACATAGLAALSIQAGRSLYQITIATAALSCEALGVQVRIIETFHCYDYIHLLMLTYDLPHGTRRACTDQVL